MHLPLPPTKLGLLFAIFLHEAASSLIIPLSWSFHLSYHWADLWSNLYSTWSALNNWAIFGALSGYQCKNINRYSILFQYRKLGEQSWNTKAWIPILINSNSNILINRLYPEWLFVCLFSFSFFSQLDLRLVDCLWHVVCFCICFVFFSATSLIWGGLIVCDMSGMAARVSWAKTSS